MYSCQYCNQNFKNKNVLANHVRWEHKRESASSEKFLIRCSCIVCKSLLTTQRINAHYHSKHVVKSKCKHCNSDIFKINNNFCSKSCAAKYNNKRKDFNFIDSGPSKGTPKPNYCEHTKIKQCVICLRYHPGKGKTCSKQCKSELTSQSLKKTIRETAFDPSKNRGRGKQSYLERSFEEWLLREYPLLRYITEKPYRNTHENKTYFADFYFPELQIIIELDGTQHKHTKDYDAARDKYISENYQVKIIRITHSEYTKQSRISEIRAILEDRTPP